MAKQNWTRAQFTGVIFSLSSLSFPHAIYLLSFFSLSFLSILSTTPHDWSCFIMNQAARASSPWSPGHWTATPTVSHPDDQRRALTEAHEGEESWASQPFFSQLQRDFRLTLMVLDFSWSIEQVNTKVVKFHAKIDAFLCSIRTLQLDLSQTSLILR